MEMDFELVGMETWKRLKGSFTQLIELAGVSSAAVLASSFREDRRRSGFERQETSSSDNSRLPSLEQRSELFSFWRSIYCVCLLRAAVRVST